MNNNFYIKEIDYKYIIDYGIKILLQFNKVLTIKDLYSNNIIFNYNINDLSNYINLFLSDERRFKYKNPFIPIKTNIKKEIKEYETSIILDFNKIYEIKKDNKIINYIKIININDHIYLLESNNLLLILNLESKIINANDQKIKILK